MSYANPTPDQMYAPGVEHRKLELVCHVHKGALRFSTPEEHASLGRTGTPRWSGTMAVTPDGLGAAYCPGLDERLTNGPHYAEAYAKVLREGVLVS